MGIITLNAKISFIFLTIYLMLSSSSCNTSSDMNIPASDTNIPALGSEHVDYAGYNLIWQDEFTTDTIDRTKWNFDTDSDGNQMGWGNTEQQEYTEDNAYIDNGALVIEARAESKNGKSFTSSRLHTHGLFSVQYGRIEARILLPSSKTGEIDEGTWPAFWLLGNDFSGWGHTQYGGTVQWPWSGEIDIMESNFNGNRYSHVSSALHYDSGTEIANANPQHRFETEETELREGTTSYHIYGAEWTENSIRFYLDDQVYFTHVFSGNQEEFKKEFFLLLNLAVGGHFVGTPDASKYPQKLYVDWLRVYQKQ